MEDKDQAQINSLPDLSEQEIETRYTDSSGITLKKLRFGLWFVERKEKFKKAFIIFVVAVGALAWTYVIWGTFSYFIFGMRKDDQMVAEMIKQRLLSHSAMVSIGATDLQIGSTYTMETGTDKYDYVVIINNPNQKYYGNFIYTLVSNGIKIEERTGFIMPGEKKYVMFLGVDKSVGQATIEFSNVGWRRVDAHAVPDLNDYIKSHLSFEVNNANFSGGRVDLNRGSKMNDLSFDVTNKNPYNYWEVNFLIGLYRNNELVGVNKYSLSQVMSGQTYNAKMSWPGVLDRADSIDIQPELNIFSNEIYMKF